MANVLRSAAVVVMSLTVVMASVFVAFYG